jgi:small subunit ribosomal protein S20
VIVSRLAAELRERADSPQGAYVSGAGRLGPPSADARSGVATGAAAWYRCLLVLRVVSHHAIRREASLYRWNGTPPDSSNEGTTSAMANIKSQIKRIGTNKKAQERNKAVKSQLKTAIRSTREAIAAGDKEQAVAALGVATKRLDKAVSKGVIHQNQAANRKSAIAKQVAAL